MDKSFKGPWLNVNAVNKSRHDRIGFSGSKNTLSKSGL